MERARRDTGGRWLGERVLSRSALRCSVRESLSRNIERLRQRVLNTIALGERERSIRHQPHLYFEDAALKMESKYVRVQLYQRLSRTSAALEWSSSIARDGRD